MFCFKKQEMYDNLKQSEKNSGIKKIETFLDYSLVDKYKYPPLPDSNTQCPKHKDNLHISFYQREPPEENKWVFGYPHYRNYLGGSNSITA